LVEGGRCGSKNILGRGNIKYKDLAAKLGQCRNNKNQEGNGTWNWEECMGESCHFVFILKAMGSPFKI
jgi:hypothetical protein